MTAHQRIVRVRRNYNQWVANQTLEDYALRFTAKSARRWSSLRVANTAIGAISFLALEAIGGAITINYGFVNAPRAIVAVGALIFLTSLPIAYYAATYGVDIDLLTRGAGFGYLGSTITSLIYASFTFLFFAIEAAIMSLALEMWFGHPALHRLRAQFAGRHSARHPRHHLHQPLSVVDPAVLDRSAPRAVRVHRHRRPCLIRAVDAFFRNGRRPKAARSTSFCSAPPRRWCSR